MTNYIFRFGKRAKDIQLVADDPQLTAKIESAYLAASELRDFLHKRIVGDWGGRET